MAQIGQAVAQVMDEINPAGMSRRHVYGLKVLSDEAARRVRVNGMDIEEYVKSHPELNELEEEITADGARIELDFMYGDGRDGASSDLRQTCRFSGECSDFAQGKKKCANPNYLKCGINFATNATELIQTFSPEELDELNELVRM